MKLIAIVIFIIVAAGIVLFVLPNINKNRQLDTENPQKNMETASSSSTTSSDVKELKIEDLKIGEGVEVKSGDVVSIHYRGTFLDGKVFDSSYDRGQPFETKIGIGQVIKGWDEGVVGMKVGGKRKLTIPPDKAYGEQGIPGDIPPNSTLVFEVELLGIK